jgi:hypothetical protein
LNDQFITSILDESKWLTTSLVIALLSISILLYKYRNSKNNSRHRVIAAMNLFYGITIGTMAFGHLLAVTIKLMLGTLEGSVTLFYLIGGALAVPSWWLIFVSLDCFTSIDYNKRLIIILNAWLSVTLLILGLHNLPLTLQAFFNIGYNMQARKETGWTIIALSVIVNLVLLVGSLIFFVSGQSFEQFDGIE